MQLNWLAGNPAPETSGKVFYFETPRTAVLELLEQRVSLVRQELGSDHVVAPGEAFVVTGDNMNRISKVVSNCCRPLRRMVPPHF